MPSSFKLLWDAWSQRWRWHLVGAPSPFPPSLSLLLRTITVSPWGLILSQSLLLSQSMKKTHPTMGEAGARTCYGVCWNNACPVVKRMMGSGWDTINATCGSPTCAGASPSSETTILSCREPRAASSGLFQFPPQDHEEAAGSGGTFCWMQLHRLFLVLPSEPRAQSGSLLCLVS